MKNIFTAIIFSTFIACISLNAQTNTFPPNGAVGIGTLSPNTSSLLEIKSTTKGLLISRMTKAQRDAIASPAKGLLIYQTNSTPGFYYYDGSTWKPISTKGWSLTGNAGTDSSVNFLGTTDKHPLVFRVNNNISGRIDYLGNNNTSFGYQGLLSNTTGFYNTAIGYNALKANKTSGRNTAIGAYALLVNTAENNTAVGTYALVANTSGIGNVATGVNALQANVGGNNNAAFGTNALYANVSGTENTAAGYAALFSNNNGNYNSAFGTTALNSNISGSWNTASGAYALSLNTSGANNTALGYSALSLNNANGNTSTGAYSLNVNTSGYFNTANGAYSLFSNSTGNNNTANGYAASYQNTTGVNNAALGAFALSTNLTGSNNTALGISSGLASEDLSFTTAVGYGASTTSSYQVRIGSIGTPGDPTSIGGKVGWSTLSDGRVKKNIKENVPGLVFINKLKPVTYNIDEDVINTIIQRPEIKDKAGKSINPSADDLVAKKAGAAIVHTGFIAQDVEKAAKSLNYDFSGVDAAKNDKDLYGLRYAEFVVPLVKAVQELSKMNDEKNAKIDYLQKQITELKAMIVSNQSTPVPLNAGVNGQQSIAISSALLQQNIPNPFTNATKIGYTLPQKFNSAQIVITDKNGKTLKTVNVSGSGEGSITINASMLASGAFQYSLIVDGKLLATKQMEHIK